MEEEKYFVENRRSDELVKIFEIHLKLGTAAMTSVRKFGVVWCLLLVLSCISCASIQEGIDCCSVLFGEIRVSFPLFSTSPEAKTTSRLYLDQP